MVCNSPLRHSDWWNIGVFNGVLWLYMYSPCSAPPCPFCSCCGFLCFMIDKSVHFTSCKFIFWSGIWNYYLFALTCTFMQQLLAVVWFCLLFSTELKKISLEIILFVIMMISCPMTKVLKNLFISCGCSSCQLESVIVWAGKNMLKCIWLSFFCCDCHRYWCSSTSVLTDELPGLCT